MLLPGVNCSTALLTAARFRAFVPVHSLLQSIIMHLGNTVALDRSKIDESARPCHWNSLALTDSLPLLHSRATFTETKLYAL